LARLRYREKVRNRNACHRATTRIVRSHGLIAVEKLNVKRMTTKGLKKKGLNREILTQSWGLLRNQLQYKAEWAGREFVEVDPKYTSQDCHRCGARNRPGRSERYACAACGLRMDRDENAALNILRAGVLTLGAETWGVSPCVAPER
jgi:putative transposase